MHKACPTATLHSVPRGRLCLALFSPEPPFLYIEGHYQSRFFCTTKQGTIQFDFACYIMAGYWVYISLTRGNSLYLSAIMKNCHPSISNRSFAMSCQALYGFCLYQARNIILSQGLWSIQFNYDTNKECLVCGLAQLFV